MFHLRHQPLKGLYLFGVALWTLFFRLPTLSLIYIPRSWRPRKTWSFKQSLSTALGKDIVHVVFNIGLPAGFNEDLDEMNASPKAKALGFVVVPAFPKDLLVGEIKKLAELQQAGIQRTFGFWYQKKGATEPSDRKAEPKENIALLFHGGAMTMGTPKPGGLASNSSIAQTLLGNCPRLSRIFSGGYRLSASAPYPQKNPFPAALLDAIASYHYLLHDLGFQAENIIIGGDSAGGFLAIALTRYIVLSQLPALPTPGALLLLSTAAEWYPTRPLTPESSMVRNDCSDACGLIYTSGYTLRSLAGTIGIDEALGNPWFSPGSSKLPKDVASSLFSGFPKTMVHIGDAEVHLDVVRAVHERLVSAIGEENVCYFEQVDASHDILLAPSMHPESVAEACKAISAWIDTL